MARKPMKSKKNIIAITIVALFLSFLLTPSLADMTTGSILVWADPHPANIYVDGEYKGESVGGGAKRIFITQGSYKLQLSAPGHKNWSKSIIVKAGEETKIDAHLQEGSGESVTRSEIISPSTRTGTIFVRVENVSLKKYIYVDEEYSGFFTLVVSVWRCPVGTHTLRLSATGYKNWSKSIIVEADNVTNIYANLEEGSGESVTRAETISPSMQTSTILVRAEPFPVKIYVDGEYSGETSYDYDDFTSLGKKSVYLPAGSYTLKLSTSGIGDKDWSKKSRGRFGPASRYKDWSQNITVAAGEETEINAYLETVSTSTEAATQIATPEPTETAKSTPTSKSTATPAPIATATLSLFPEGSSNITPTSKLDADKKGVPMWAVYILVIAALTTILTGAWKGIQFFKKKQAK